VAVADEPKEIEGPCVTKKDEKCVFPFIYKGKPHDKCTFVENDGVAWCSTKTDSTDKHVTESWGPCNLDTCEVETSPLEKVTNLLENLRDRIIEDDKREQKMYDNYACWCETTTQEKSQKIDDARDKLRALGQMILKLKGKVAIRTAEINKLTVDIKENEEAQSEATSIRTKENSAYQADVSEIMQATSALEKAITVLKGAAAFLQDGAKAAEVAHHITAVFAALPDAGSTSATKATPSQLKLLRKAASELQSGNRAKYAPQSATIQGILTDMYSTFGDDLQNKYEAEATSNRNYEDFIATKQDELETLQKTLKKKTSEKAEAEVMLAEASQSYDDTEREMESDILFFDLTKDACTAKSDEWKIRKDLRKQELEGIEKALEILTSDETKALFEVAKPAASFLQLGMASESSAARVRKAYDVMKAVASRTKSLRLAKLAATVAMTKVGHFDKVLKAIDEMIEELKSEQDQDTEKRDLCLDEYQMINRHVAELDWKIEVNEAEIAKLQAQIEAKEKELEETIKAIEDIIKEIADMKDQRKKENEEFLEAKKADEDAIEVMTKAKDAMEEYYKEHAKFLLLQQAAAAAAKQPKGPCLTEKEESCQLPFRYGDKTYAFCTDVDNDGVAWCSTAATGSKFDHVPGKWGACNMATCLTAPPADFSDKDSNKNESKGIVELMSLIIEDLEGEIRSAIEGEEEAQLAFEKALAAAEQLKADLEEKKINLEGVIADTKEKKLEEEDIKTTNEDNRTETKNYKKEIKEECDWMIDNYSKRREARNSELDGLATAKELLAGMIMPASSAFVQHNATAPVAPLRRPSFLAHAK
jgi:hypothetical protein